MLAVFVMACGGYATSISPVSTAADSYPLLEPIPVGEHPLIGDAQYLPGDSIRFERLSVEHGLAHNSVSCILQDRRGFMWFGTGDGLNRYDGYEFKAYRYDPDDPHSLSPGSVQSLLEDRAGRLWIVTESGGVVRYDPETERFFRYQHDPGVSTSLSDNSISAMVEDAEGAIWIGTTNGGLNQYDPQADRFIRYRHDPEDRHSLSHDKVYALYQDRAGVIWVGTAAGLDRLDRETGRFAHFQHDPRDPHSLGSGGVRSVHEDRAGRLWVLTSDDRLSLLDRETGYAVPYPHATNVSQTLDESERVVQVYEDRLGLLWIWHLGGLSRFNPETRVLTRYRVDPDDLYSPSHDVKFVTEDRAGNLWVGTLMGLERFDRNRGRFIHYRHDADDPHSLSDDRVISFYEDRAGVLWIGTVGQGLNTYDPQSVKFALYHLDPNALDSASNNIVSAIYQDRTGMLWIGTQAGLNRLDRTSGRLTRYRHDPEDRHSLSADWVFSIFEDRAGVLWVGTEAGLDKLDRETGYFTHYRNVPQSGRGWIHGPTAIVQDQSGALWLGVQGWGLDRFDPLTGQFAHYEHRPGGDQWDRSHTVQALYEDRAGVLWMGTQGGLFRFDRATETFVSYHHNPGDVQSLSSDDVLSIYEDRSGALWIGMGGSGLNRLVLGYDDGFDRATETFTRYTEQDGMPSGVVYGILGDDHDNLWLSTNRGVSKFDPRTGTFRNYDVGNGLQSDEFSPGAWCKSPSGEMLFGGINGFNTFYPDDVLDNPYSPPVVLTSLTQGGKAVDLGGRAVESVTELVLEWPSNFFEFEFAVLSYSRPEMNQYAYMLEGFDTYWNVIGTERSGRYTNLPGGTYTLRLKGANGDGVWNEEGISVRIVVVPPFWRTWWFVGLGALVLAGGLLGGYRLRVRSIEAHNRDLKLMVAERTHALEQRTYEIERRRQELEALYHADERMHRHLHLEQVLQALVDVAVDILKADKSAVLVWDERHEKLAIKVARGFGAEATAALSFACQEEITGRVVSGGEPIIVEDSLADRRWQQKRPETLRALDSEDVRSFAHLPLKVGNEVFGIFNASFTAPHVFGEDERRLFLAVVQRAAMAIENARLYEQTQELAVVEERSRLARDLHDAVTQTLFSASLIAEALPALWETDQKEGRHLLGELRRLSRGALAEMRTLLLELRPAALVEANLGDLVRQLAEAIAGRTGIPVAVTAKGYCVLPPDVHVALYRIAQEALNNVVKHARASQVTVSLNCDTFEFSASSCDATRVELQIGDDGCGFDPCAVPPDHLGLGIMRERAQAIGATLEITSQCGCGTQVLAVWTKERQ